MSALANRIPWLVLVFGIGIPQVGANEPPRVQLARDGQPSIGIVVGTRASPGSRAQANVLADYLGRIIGSRFQVAEGDGRQGIAVGCASEFPTLGLAAAFRDKGPAWREQYVLRSHPGGLYVIGASDLAVRHAVWDLLYRLGHRQFFPGPTWEIVPSQRNLSVAVDTNQKPDYLVRNIWYGHGLWGYNNEPYAAWKERNRTESAFVLNTGHSYDAIIQRFRDTFAAHPEYLGLLDGKRTSSKFCIANAALRQLVVRYALAHFQEHPDSDSVSAEPSDGGGWCQCAQCAALGSPSDRALLLANEVSAALEKRFPDKYVAIYAYAFHSPPPKLLARPRVIVSVATSFLRGGWTLDEIIAGWQKQGVRQFGIREYYDVWSWNHELPGGARGTDPRYLQETIPKFATMGARFMSAESGDCWGPNGLGYYLAARMMWDVKEAARVKELRADFLEKAFGAARSPMEEFYRLLDAAERPLMSDDLVGRMYRLLADASPMSKDAKIRARLDDLVLYTRYVDLYRKYSNAHGSARQAAMEALIRHVYRMRRTMMVHSLAIYRTIERDRSIRIPQEAAWDIPETENPWKSSRPWSREELDAIVAKGIASHRLRGFTAVSLSRDLVPPRPLKLPDLPPLEDSGRGRGRRTFLTWIDHAPATIDLKVTGGLIAHYRDRGAVRIDTRRWPGEEPLRQQGRVPPDGKPRDVTLHFEQPGLYAVLADDGSDMTEIVWPNGVYRTIEVNRESSPEVGHRSGYFYVPRGTALVAGYCAGRGTLGTADGKTVLKLSGEPDYFSVQVPVGQDGRLWTFRDCAELMLMTVPPFSARSPAELLLPREVVQAEAAKAQVPNAASP